MFNIDDIDLVGIHSLTLEKKGVFRIDYIMFIVYLIELM